MGGVVDVNLTAVSDCWFADRTPTHNGLVLNVCENVVTVSHTRGGTWAAPVSFTCFVAPHLSVLSAPGVVHTKLQELHALDTKRVPMAVRSCRRRARPRTGAGTGGGSISGSGPLHHQLRILDSELESGVMYNMGLVRNKSFVNEFDMLRSFVHDADLYQTGTERDSDWISMLLEPQQVKCTSLAAFEPSERVALEMIHCALVLGHVMCTIASGTCADRPWCYFGETMACTRAVVVKLRMHSGATYARPFT